MGVGYIRRAGDDDRAAHRALALLKEDLARRKRRAGDRRREVCNHLVGEARGPPLGLDGGGGRAAGGDAVEGSALRLDIFEMLDHLRYGEGRGQRRVDFVLRTRKGAGAGGGRVGAWGK